MSPGTRPDAWQATIWHNAGCVDQTMSFPTFFSVPGMMPRMGNCDSSASSEHVGLKAIVRILEQQEDAIRVLLVRLERRSRNSDSRNTPALAPFFFEPCCAPRRVSMHRSFRREYPPAFPSGRDRLDYCGWRHSAATPSRSRGPLLRGVTVPGLGGDNPPPGWRLLPAVFRARGWTAGFAAGRPLLHPKSLASQRQWRRQVLKDEPRIGNVPAVCHSTWRISR